MKVRVEIEKDADEKDKPVLLWLFERYHWQSQWNFVARFSYVKYGTKSYEYHTVWTPSPEGQILYDHGSTHQ